MRKLSWATRSPSTCTTSSIIFSTKQRRPLIKDRIRQQLREYLCGIARNTQGKILNVNGVEDHLHVLASIKPSISVSDFVRTIKANSSRWASERTLFDWQDGYSSFTVSKSIEPRVSAYIDGQVEHHSRVPYAEELCILLAKHEIEFDPQHYLD
jgi:REP element-mobilizing transposase RayT